MKTVELRDERTGVKVTDSFAQFDQNCDLCGENMRGRYIVSIGDGKSWVCSLHLRNLLQDLPDARPEPGPEPRTRNEVVYQKGSLFSQELKLACTAASHDGMVLVGTTEVGRGYVVMSFVGAEHLFEEVEDV